jgi:membrane fusion protein (multidrug efflux system)
MKRPIRLIIVALVIAVLATLVWWFFHRHSEASSEEHASGEAGEEKKEVVAHVQTAKIEQKTISEKIIAYGSVIAQPGKTHSVSVAFETRVQHILVAPGQLVREGDPLVEIEPSPAAQLQLQQAKNAAESTQKELKQTEQRFNLKLATNQDLGTAQKAARDAELQFASLQKAGVGTDNRIHSDMAGLVDKVDAQNGQIVATGAPLVEIVAEDEIEVKLGVEAENLSALGPGQTIAIVPVNDPNIGNVVGTMRLVTHRVDPDTRLVDVFVSLPEGTQLLLDGYVRGEVTRSSSDALVVPRSAILPEDGSFTLFTLRENHAVKHTVKTGLENGREIEVIASDLHAGDDVVTIGNYELDDGMSVEVQNAK